MNSVPSAKGESYLSCNVLGVNFIDEPVGRCIEVVSRGGLLVVPSGPGLATIDRDPVYKEAIQRADFALADSGYLVLLLRFFKLRSMHRISGLRFMDKLLNNARFQSRFKTLWVMPRDEEIAATKEVLKGRGVQFEDTDFHVAPFYQDPNKVEDMELLADIERDRPDWVILNIAGGKQEKLGLYLRNNLSYKPAIICTGAAIAFLSGEQAHIPSWADRLYLGWLCRIVENPRVYGRRYWEALSLFGKIAFNRGVHVTKAERAYPSGASLDFDRQLP